MLEPQTSSNTVALDVFFSCPQPIMVASYRHNTYRLLSDAGPTLSQRRLRLRKVFLYLHGLCARASCFNHRLNAYKIVGHFFGQSYPHFPWIIRSKVVFLESVTFQLHARMLSSQVAQSLKRLGHFSDLGVKIAFNPENKPVRYNTRLEHRFALIAVYLCV